MSHHIVIVGGGFAGALAARRLMEQHLPDTDVLLIDKQADFLFTPRLVDALASHDAHGNGWSAPLHELAARFGFRFLRGTVEHVNREQKTLTVYTEDLGTKTVPYDTLVLTPGAKACHYRIPGAAEHTYTLKSLDDVKRVHDRINELLRQAQQEEAVATKRRLLSFIVVGAGPSGVEGIFSLLHYVRSWCEKQGAATLFDVATFSLIQAGPQILPGFPPKMVHDLGKELHKHRIRLFVGEAVTEVTNEALTTNLKHTLPASLVLWTAGIQPNRLTVDPEAHCDPSGYLIVDRHLQVESSIFAAGDAILYREHNQVIPRNAQTAILMGQALAENIARSLRHLSLKPFHYRSKGNVLVVGNIGSLDLKWFSLKTRFAPLVRNFFYRFRFWQITGK